MEQHFIRFANATAQMAGKPLTFGACVAIVLIWAVTGPMFGYSDAWQLVINTGTTIVTFLMVFLIQNTQNRDGAAIQAKLDELIHAVRPADERFIGIEHLKERELQEILQQVEARAARLHGEGKPVIRTRAEDVRTASKSGKPAGGAAGRRKAAPGKGPRRAAKAKSS